MIYTKISIKIIIKVIGIILLVESLFMFSVLPVSLHFGGEDFMPILVSGILTLTAGALMWLLNIRANHKEMSKKDGLLIVVAIWIIIAAFGSLPYIFSGYFPSFTDAFFESISGFSTTGASILTDIEILPKGILFWRSLTHWMGGMGIIVLVFALLSLFGFAGMSLVGFEAPAFTHDKLHPHIMATLRRLWFVYIVLTLAETTLLIIGNMNWYEAVCHSLATVSTGGFSPKNSSISAYSPYIQYVIILFMILGGTSFYLHYFFFKGKFRNIIKNEEFVFYILVIVSATLLITAGLFLKADYGMEESFRFSFFQVVSIITCTGFVTDDYMLWPSYLYFLLFLLMFTGGMTGSTSGGLKMLRHLLLFKNIKSRFMHYMHPNIVLNIKFMDKLVSKTEILNVITLFMIYISSFALGVFVLVVFDLNFMDSCGSVASCMAGIGPGLGTTGAVGNYSALHDVSKWTLSSLMLLGRLEFISVIVVFSRSFWKKY